MTLQDFSPEELQVLKKALSNKKFQDLLRSRMDDILKNEWDREIVTVEDRVKLAKAKGLYNAWESLLNLVGQIEVEEEIRQLEEEKELALAAKRKR